MTTIMIIAAAIICIIGLIGTIKVGINPQDKDYDKKAKKHFTNLSLLYVVAFVPAIILTIVYFVFWR
ncbi:hypothetical protein FLK61_31735 [Paenalkalicoccus suaedae]|uniref:Uncharacterized protein n=1 Tax=Paenalkalicoccus suaedae TaxID=2592382 RepID=A0A859FKC6_9BACI|nr:hypothetical protein [Paenalkalicoccus suaedae]QKS73236.1 hypothetical protein FLK61_31735 [Paenalkalicoccus suaedae]